MTIASRLEQLDGLIREPHLLNNQGIGNEIGFYIFDYDPKDELIVAEHLPKLQLSLVDQGVKVREFNLYQIILDILQIEKVFEDSLLMELEQGHGTLAKALNDLITPKEVIEHIKSRLQGDEDILDLLGNKSNV